MNFIAGVTLFLIVAAMFIEVELKRGKRKRSLGDLENMEQEFTGLEPSQLIGYGNYCGRTDGSGTPVDQIDTCCMQHGQCYASVTALDTAKECTADSDGTPFSNVYLAPTKWYKNANNDIVCESSATSANDCNYQVCSCDKALVNCIKANVKYYNASYLDHDKVLAALVQFTQDKPNLVKFEDKAISAANTVVSWFKKVF